LNFLKRQVLAIQEASFLLVHALRGLFSPPRYVADLLIQMDVIGFGSLPIVLLTGLFTGGVLGRTGARVSILAMGTGSRFLTYKEEDKAIEAVQRALDLGITYIDSADDYGKERHADAPQQRCNEDQEKQ